MSRIIARILTSLALTSTFAFAACDDDSSTATPSPDVTTTTDTAAPADDVAAPADDAAAPADDAAAPAEDAAAPTGDAAAPAGGACTNAADLAIIQNASYDPVAKATACGLDNVNLALGGDIDGFTTAAETCMKDDSYKDDAKFAFVLSDACGGCYVGSVRCTAVNCLASCAVDAASDACVTCRADNGCVSGFYTCSGLPAPAPAE
jgi:hypothetical protein